jgi:dTDP-4-amino-4,6-dideoxygalactose transaminase
MRGYKNFTNKKNMLKETEKKSKIIFSLPIYPTLKNTEVDLIIKNLINVLLEINE